MKYAWVIDSIIKDVCWHEDPTSVYTPEVAAYYTTQVPDYAQNGWVNNNGVWEAPSPPPVVEPVALAEPAAQ
jgi:hypothetical protein